MLFHTGLPKSIWILLRSDPPLHKCFLRAKGYHCHFCGLLPAVFLWKTFLFLQTIIFSPQPSGHLLSLFCCFLPFAPCAAQGWERSGHGRSWFVRWVTLWQLPSKGEWLGNGDSKPIVKEPRNYSELCQAPQHCLTLFCISEFVLNQWMWRRFGIRSTVTVEMHTSSFLASLPSCFLKQISPSQKIVMTFLRS